MQPTKDQLKEARLAIEDLKRKYLDVPQITIYAGNVMDGAPWFCPLCNMARPRGTKAYEKGPYMKCPCPWIWFEKKPCIENCNPNFKEYEVDKNLARCDRWLAEIDRRLAE